MGVGGRCVCTRTRAHVPGTHTPASATQFAGHVPATSAVANSFLRLSWGASLEPNGFCLDGLIPEAA